MRPSSSLKTILLLAVFAALAIVGASPTRAQYVPGGNVPAQVCNSLSGTPAMCVTNATSWPIVGIQAVSSATWGSSWISIPGGMIPPGGTAIVHFPVWSGGCNQHVVVRTASGAIHSFPYANVCLLTRFTIRGW